MLLVEDNADTREVLTMLVEFEGYPVVAVENGKEALDQLTSGLTPCLILLDFHMPVMNGREFRQEQLRLRVQPDVPVVMYSAAAQVDVTGLQLTDLIMKPTGLDAIVDAVNRWCAVDH